ncbi:MAG TPA: hypothetical protein VI078_01440 [bacterium]
MTRHGRSAQRSLGALATAALILAWAGPAAAAEAGGAAARVWTSSIDYFNPGTAAATLSVSYRDAAGTGVDTATVPISAGASGSVLVGATMPPGFAGAALASSDRPIAVLYRQQATGAATTAPMLYAPFTAARAGTGRFFVPEVRRGGAGNTVIGIQNPGSRDISLSLDFFSATSAFQKTVNLPAVKPLSSAVVNLATMGTLGTTFDGSLVIRAANTVGGAPARVLAAAETVPAAGREAYAFAGMSNAATQVLMPAALCVPSATGTLRSLFQVQNAAKTGARFVVAYYYPVTSGGRTTVRTASASTGLVAPGKRVTIDPCAVAAIAGKSKVVAVISGRDAAGKASPVAALARWVKGASGTQYAAAALPPAVALDAKYRVVFPAVEWGPAGTRTTVTVMNGAPKAVAVATPFPVTVSFYSQAGVLVKAVTGSVVTAASFDPSAAGALVSGVFRGAVVVESSRPIAAAAQVQQVGYTVADGYAGIPW